MKRNVARGEARQKILETTFRIVGKEGAGAVTAARVARDTGVSRQAVYLFFGSRAGLLSAALRERDAASGIGRIMLRCAAGRPSPAALAALIEAWFGYLPQIDEASAAMEAAAAVDTDAAAAWAERVGAFRSLLAAVIGRIATAPGLAPGWTVETATDFAFMITRISNWRSLVVERGWAPSRAVGAVVGAITATILKPDND